MYLLAAGPCLGQNRVWVWDAFGRVASSEAFACVFTVCHALRMLPEPVRLGTIVLESRFPAVPRGCATLSVVPGPSFFLPSGHVVNLLQNVSGQLELETGGVLSAHGECVSLQCPRSYYDLITGEMVFWLPLRLSGDWPARFIALVLWGMRVESGAVWVKAQVTVLPPDSEDSGFPAESSSGGFLQ